MRFEWRRTCQAWLQPRTCVPRGLNHATEAVKAFVKAGTLTQRDRPKRRTASVCSCFELGADADAEKCLNRSIELAPTCAFAHRNLGACGIARDVGRG